MDGFIIKIIFCVILSSMLGLERQYHKGIVGMRTNILVALGSFLFVIFALSEFEGDQIRMAASVVTGVGFLGAGVIIQYGNKVLGIDTAATLWCVASIGVLCAGGMIFEATIGTLFILASNFILRYWTHREDAKKEKKYHKCSIKVGCDEEHEMEIRNLILDKISKDNITMESFEKSFTNKGNVYLNFVFISKNIKFLEPLINKISDKDGVNKISWSNEVLDDSIVKINH